MAGDRQIRFTQHHPRDRIGIDRVGLARAATGATGPGHQSGGNTGDPLARGDQVTLQARGHMTAVFNAPRQVVVTELEQCPVQGRGVPGVGGLDGLFGQFSTVAVQRHQGVGLLVRIHTDHHSQPPTVRSAPGRRRKLQGDLLGSSPGVGSRVRSLPVGGSKPD